LLVASLVLALIVGGGLVPAEARDLLVLRSELRRGELLDCDATACRVVGSDPDPEPPRLLDAPGWRMKGEYGITHDFGESTSLAEFVSWELARVSASCDAPQALPALPADDEPPDGAEP
jgi:hypothetical protein